MRFVAFKTLPLEAAGEHYVCDYSFTEKSLILNIIA